MLLTPYLIGVVTAPLVAKIVKPMLRSAVKASVGVALEVKKAAYEAGEEIQDITAEVTSERDVGPVKAPGRRVGDKGTT